jgi:hypothetical protein
MYVWWDLSLIPSMKTGSPDSYFSWFLPVLPVKAWDRTGLPPSTSILITSYNFFTKATQSLHLI